MNAIEQHNAQNINHDTNTLSFGELANAHAKASLFESYRKRKSQNTHDAQRRALKRFGSWIASKGQAVDIDGLYATPYAWSFGMTWGVLLNYQNYLLEDGVPLSTINQYISIIRTYCGLICQAEMVSGDELKRIQEVKGVKSAKEASNLNIGREQKKARKTVNTLTEKQVKQLKKLLTKNQTDRGKRDMLLFECLFGYGLRVSEVTILTINSFDGGHLSFSRPKTGSRGNHKLDSSAKLAFSAYAEIVRGDKVFFQTAKRGSKLTGKPMSRQSVHHVVKRWGERIGISGLSPHDARHTAATIISKQAGISSTEFLNYFGWASLSTAQRYIELNEISNKGIKKPC